MLDSYSRDIDYLRISLTDSCNFKCKYCSPCDNIHCYEKNMSQEQIVDLVKLFSKVGIKKIRLTGGEPLLRKDLVEIVREIKGISGIEEITMTTNGFLLSDKLEELKKAGLDRVNLSLDTFKRDKFKGITGVDGLNKILLSIDRLEELNMVPIKINCVLINDFNSDEIGEFIKFTRDRKVQIRFIELMTMGDNIEWGKGKQYSAEEVLKKYRELKFYREENIAKIYKLTGSKGEVGFISPNSNKFCSSCNRIRVTSEGKLKLCLHSDIEYDLLGVLGERDPLGALKKIMGEKPKEHRLDEKKYIKKNMVSIGG